MIEGASNLDRLVTEATTDGTPVHDLLRLQMQLAGYRYRFGEVVAQLSKAAMQAEIDRKSLVALAKLRARAEHKGPRQLSNDAATEAAEQLPEVARAHTAEIEAQGMYEAAKLKMNASGDVLMSLQMRIAHARDEAKQTRSISSHEHNGR